MQFYVIEEIFVIDQVGAWISVPTVVAAEQSRTAVEP